MYRPTQRCKALIILRPLPAAHLVTRLRVDNRAKLVAKLIHPEGFVEKTVDSTISQPMADLLLVEPTHNDDRNIGTNTANGNKCLLTVHHRHGQVQEDAAEPVGRVDELVQRINADG